MSHLSEWFGGKFARNQVLFTGKRRHLTSMEVRGVQMAEELGGVCTRCRYLAEPAVASAPALFWVIEPDLELVKKFDPLTPQFFDPINPRLDPSGEFARMNRSFRNLLLNTRSSLHWLGLDRELVESSTMRPAEAEAAAWMELSDGTRAWVIPHHHCNATGYCLPAARLERPMVVGYLGQPEHLHDGEDIEVAVRKLGLEFRSFDTWQLGAYEQIDIGIAWTRRDELRDQTRSNIKLANFAAHGIPSVVCDYESYREMNSRLGQAALIASTLQGFLESLEEVASSEDLRRSLHHNGIRAQEVYSRPAISQIYRAAIRQAAAEPPTNSRNDARV